MARGIQFAEQPRNRNTIYSRPMRVDVICKANGIGHWLALTTIITMEDGGSGTRYIARARHKSPEDSQKHEEMGLEEGWGITTDQLAKLAESL
jgi:uncharacterized protein YndB with AHSA1/START domain